MRVLQDIKDKRSHGTVWILEAATYKSYTKTMQARLYINVNRG